MIQVLTADEFKKDVFDYSLSDSPVFEKPTPVIVNFFADWCGPCQSFAPTLSATAETYAGLLNIYKVNIDESPEIPALFGVRSIPTTVFFAQGEEPALAMGVITEDGLMNAIKDLFALDAPNVR